MLLARVLHAVGGGSRVKVVDPMVLVATTEEVFASPDFSEEMLTLEERRRVAAFRRDEDRAGFVAAHALVRICAMRLLGLPAASLRLVQRCDTCGGPHGRPVLADHGGMYLSMAHTRGVVTAAAGWGPVGVDVERVPRRRAEADMNAHALSEAELAVVRQARDPHAAFLRQWVRKEALIKIGSATLAGLREVDLAHLPLDDGVETAQRLSPLGGRWPHLHLLDWWDLTRRVIGAAIGDRPPRLSALG